MNTVQKGFSRDREILDLIDKHQALDANQVASLLFGGIRTGQRKAQERLQKLQASKALNRKRLSICEPYAYYQGRLSGRADHLIAVNWAYVWLVRQMKAWHRFVSWELEQDYKALVCDGLFAQKNTVTGELELTFVEMDLSDNPWDKTVKYNTVHDKGYASGKWWFAESRRFPQILCITTNETRAKTIQQSIRQDNKWDLRFTVKLYDDIRREAFPWASK